MLQQIPCRIKTLGSALGFDCWVLINFRTGMLFLPAGTANQYLARGWFDRNSPHRARSLLGDRKLKEPSRDFPSGLGIDPGNMPPTTSSKSIGGSSTIALSRSFCRPHPSPIWVPKGRSRTHCCLLRAEQGVESFNAKPERIFWRQQLRSFWT